jgi:hypothetical protein
MLTKGRKKRIREDEKMKTIKIIMMHSAQALMVFLIYYVTVHCGFAPEKNYCAMLDQAPLAALTSSSDPNAEKRFEDPGIIAVYHGFGCAKSDKSGTQDILKVAQSRDIDGYANATVVLNGWHLKYLDDNQNVAGLATLIRNIQLTRTTRVGKGTLKWQAEGLLSDDNFDNPYDWCYYWTVIAWNPTNIDLIVDHKDGDCTSHNPSDVNFFFAGNKDTTTALSSFPTILQNNGFDGKKTATIVPRGFGFKWNLGNSFADHHLLQIGYNLEHSEIFNQKHTPYYKGYRGYSQSTENFSFVDSGYVSWETYAIFKDNATRRNYEFGEMVSELGGNDLGVIQPPFSILPIDVSNTGCNAGAGLNTEDFEIQNIPYQYAIPVLTGWELSYLCDSDQKVKEIGLWIDTWSYEKDPASSTGKLHYTLSSSLHDNDTWPDFFQEHKVNILGIKPLSANVKSNRSK